MKLALIAALGLAVGLPPGDPTEIDFQELSDFEYEEGMELPSSVTQYNEKSITVAGFMRREDEMSGGASAHVGDEVEYFMLVNDACGCEGTPKLNEIVFCAMPEGQTTKILPGVVKITGTLFVGEEKEDDIVLAIYTMDVDSLGDNDHATNR